MTRRTLRGRRSSRTRASKKPLSLPVLIVALAVVGAVVLWPELMTELGMQPPANIGSDASQTPGSPRPRATDTAPGHGERAQVVRVVDGDTIRIAAGPGQTTAIRVLGIDCPESEANQKCVRDGRAGRLSCAQQVPLGIEASRRAAALLEGARVVLECDGRCRKGGYGRDLRYLRLANGEDFGLLMIREGLCWDYGGKYPHPRRAGYARVQAEARSRGLGLWGAGKAEPL